MFDRPYYEMYRHKDGVILRVAVNEEDPAAAVACLEGFVAELRRQFGSAGPHDGPSTRSELRTIFQGLEDRSS